MSALMIDATLEISMQLDPSDERDIDIILETMLQGAVNAVSNRKPCGLGYSYTFMQKKTKRGLTISPRKAS